MRVRKLVIVGLLGGCLWPALQAQHLMDMRDKSFNFGAKVGLNSIFPYFTELTLDGNAIEKTYASYQVIRLRSSAGSTRSVSSSSPASRGNMAAAKSPSSTILQPNQPNRPTRIRPTPQRLVTCPFQARVLKCRCCSVITWCGRLPTD